MTQVGEETKLLKDVHLMIMLICLNKDGLLQIIKQTTGATHFKIMKNLFFFVTLFLVVTNTFNVRTNARILTSNILDTTSNIIHP